MNELTTIKRKVVSLFDAGDIAGLGRLYEVLNRITAEAAALLALLDPPALEKEQEPLELEMVQEDEMLFVDDLPGGDDAK